ncbi:MAG: hypothetical protein OXG42_00495 [Chloroflexi bacterium]|nr:hypothetical protein [Chloroflexota bacterium]
MFGYLLQRDFDPSIVVLSSDHPDICHAAVVCRQVDTPARIPANIVTARYTFIGRRFSCEPQATEEDGVNQSSHRAMRCSVLIAARIVHCAASPEHRTGGATFQWRLTL